MAIFWVKNKYEILCQLCHPELMVCLLDLTKQNILSLGARPALSRVIVGCSKLSFHKNASFLSGRFTIMAVINQPERKLAKRTCVHCNPLQGNYRVELVHREIPVVITGNGFAAYNLPSQSAVQKLSMSMNNPRKIWNNHISNITILDKKCPKTYTVELWGPSSLKNSDALLLPSCPCSESPIIQQLFWDSPEFKVNVHFELSDELSDVSLISPSPK